MHWRLCLGWPSGVMGHATRCWAVYLHHSLRVSRSWLSKSAVVCRFLISSRQLMPQSLPPISTDTPLNYDESLQFPDSPGSFREAQSFKLTRNVSIRGYSSPDHWVST
ncbi:hypothetical protein EV126DRAFT_434202 [Verticillium dahliae]|nr:hypothetical protein EV126DRAFT_434202 [Verticillium dahliae]